MTDYFIHSTSIIDKDVNVGNGTKIWHFSHVMPRVKIGDECILSQNVFIGSDVLIGDRVKIQNNVSIYAGVILEDDVFCGPSCVFTNVLTPRAFVERKDEYMQTRICKGVTIGANATIVCGVTIGCYAMVGAGAVVTKDIKEYELVVGNPATPIGWVSRTGDRLGDDLICPRTGEKYMATENGLISDE